MDPYPILGYSFSKGLSFLSLSTIEVFSCSESEGGEGFLITCYININKKKL